MLRADSGKIICLLLVALSLELRVVLVSRDVVRVASEPEHVNVNLVDQPVRQRLLPRQNRRRRLILRPDPQNSVLPAPRTTRPLLLESEPGVNLFEGSDDGLLVTGLLRNEEATIVMPKGQIQSVTEPQPATFWMMPRWLGARNT